MIEPGTGRLPSFLLFRSPTAVIFLILTGLFLPRLAGAQETLMLLDDPGIFPLDRHFAFLEDPSGELTIHDVSSPPFSERFIPNTGNSLNLGPTDSAYWLRFTVDNRSEKFITWILEAEYIWHREMELYIPDGAGAYLVKKTGHIYPVKNQDIKTSKLLFDFTVGIGRKETLYLRITTRDVLILSFTVLSYNRYTAIDHESQLLYGIFYGTLFIMMLYNLVLFLFNRDSSFLHFSLWVLVVILSQLQSNGLYYEYLAPFVKKFLRTDPYYTIKGLSSIFLILFVRAFLQIKRYTPKFHRPSLYLLIPGALTIVTGFFVPDWIIDTALTYWDILQSVIGIVLFIIVYRKGNRSALLLLVGFGIQIFFIIPSSLSFLGRISYSLLAMNADQFGIMFTIVFFSFVLGYRYRMISREKETAERVTEEQTLFFMNLSHEMKTPLTLVSGYLREYIHIHGMTPELAVMERNIEKLRRDMVNFFDVLKFRKGKIVYDHDAVIDLSRFLVQQAELFRSMAAARGILITHEIEPGLYIKANQLALERIANNLLENAIRYNLDNGSVSIRAKSDAGNISVSFSNTGEGIDPSRVSTIFEPFVQLSGEKRNTQGIGLGLAIVREIVDSLGGTVRVVTRPGEGCSIELTLKRHLPLSGETILSGETLIGDLRPCPTEIGLTPPAPYEPERAMAADGQPKPPVLLVEDNRELVALLCRTLSPRYLVQTASDGEEALAVLAGMDEHAVPRLIVSDIMMDGMDGRAFLTRIRSDPRLEAIPFIFITARSEPEEILEAFREGAVDFIRKPFMAEELSAKIDSLIRLREASDRMKAQERFASLGILMSSISHEIFNPLSGIRGPLENIRKLAASSGLAEDEKFRKHLNYISESVDSIERIVRNLTAILTSGEIQEEDIPLADLVRRVFDSVRAEGGERVSLTTAIPADAVIRSNPAVGYHILRNLVLNAVNASDDAGRVTVAYDPPGKGRGGIISVSDTGRGMNAETIPRIFEPFFTSVRETEENAGLGLGLFVVKQLCDKGGWGIRVQSEIGKGTVFYLTLP